MRRLSASDDIHERERIAIHMLARGKTIRSIALQLGVTEKTVYNWRQRPVVQRAIFKEQQNLLDDSNAQGVDVVPNAISTLVSIMNDPAARPSDRIAASKALIGGAHAYQERKILERTVSDLENTLGRLTEDLEGALPEGEAPVAFNLPPASGDGGAA